VCLLPDFEAFGSNLTNPTVRLSVIILRFLASQQLENPHQMHQIFTFIQVLESNVHFWNPMLVNTIIIVFMNNKALSSIQSQCQTLRLSRSLNAGHITVTQYASPLVMTRH
jgi:hypothetical protein